MLYFEGIGVQPCSSSAYVRMCESLSAVLVVLLKHCCLFWGLSRPLLLFVHTILEDKSKHFYFFKILVYSIETSNAHSDVKGFFPLRLWNYYFIPFEFLPLIYCFFSTDICKSCGFCDKNKHDWVLQNLCLTLFTTMILLLTLSLLICDGHIYLENAVENLNNYKAKIT